MKIEEYNKLGFGEKMDHQQELKDALPDLIKDDSLSGHIVVIGENENPRFITILEKIPLGEEEEMNERTKQELIAKYKNQQHVLIENVE